MANETTMALLGTAGIAPDQWAAEISMAAVARSVMMNKVRRYVLPPGEIMTVPKLDSRTVTEAAAQAAGDITFQEIASTGEALVNSFAYNAMKIQRQGLNALSPERLRMILSAQTTMAGQALANKVDSNLLGLHATGGGSGYTGTAVTASSGIDASSLREAIGNLVAANAPLPYFVVLHTNEWQNLAGISELDQWQIRGDQPILSNTGANGDFSYRGVIISCTGNVPLSTNRKGVAFSGEAFGLVMRESASIVEQFDITDLTHKIVVVSDFAYDLVRPEWACLITGQTA